MSKIQEELGGAIRERAEGKWKATTHPSIATLAVYETSPQNRKRSSHVSRSEFLDKFPLQDEYVEKSSPKAVERRSAGHVTLAVFGSDVLRCRNAPWIHARHSQEAAREQRSARQHDDQGGKLRSSAAEAPMGRTKRNSPGTSTQWI